MASITQRHGRFLVRVRRNGFPTVTKTFTRKPDAAAWARQVEVDMESGRWIADSSPPPTLRQAIQEYRSTVAAGLKGASTYRYRYDEFEAMPLARLPINEILPAHLSQWRDKQAARLSPGTVLRKLAILAGVFTWAQKDRGWITVNPVAAVRKPKAPQGRARIICDVEMAYLMDAATTSKATWLPAALVLLSHSAMRRGELFGLRRGDIDYERAILHLKDTKNGTPRDVPLCPRSLASLKVLDAAALARGSDRILPVGTVGSISTRFTRTVARAKILYQNDCGATSVVPDPLFMDDLRLHDLRHHAVTFWANSGALSLVELMSISGHKTPSMLVRYTHLNVPVLAVKLAAISKHSTE